MSEADRAVTTVEYIAPPSHTRGRRRDHTSVHHLVAEANRDAQPDLVKNDIPARTEGTSPYHGRAGS